MLYLCSWTAKTWLRICVFPKNILSKITGPQFLAFLNIQDQAWILCSVKHCCLCINLTDTLTDALMVLHNCAFVCTFACALPCTEQRQMCFVMWRQHYCPGASVFRLTPQLAHSRVCRLKFTGKPRVEREPVTGLKAKRIYGNWLVLGTTL